MGFITNFANLLIRTFSSGSEKSYSTDLSNESNSTKTKEELLLQRYKFGSVLGKGHFATVRKCYDNQNNCDLAVKCIEKQRLSSKDLKALFQEIEILQELNHPNIITFKTSIETETHFFLITEYAAGGELFDRIVEKDFYSEVDARDTMLKLCKAVDYCHEKGIVHRDIKPENILLMSKEADSDIVLADFGFAKFESTGLQTKLGTPGYIAPEILKGTPRYTPAVDIWSLGVILYILLCGYPPFNSKSRSRLYQSIIAGKYEFHVEHWNNVSSLAKDLITKMLVVHPRNRFNIKHVLCHPWLCEATCWQRSNSVNLAFTVERLKNYQAKRRLRRGQKVVQAAVRLLNNDVTKVAKRTLYRLTSQRSLSDSKIHAENHEEK